MRESQYQSHVIERLREEFDGCFVTKWDPFQGVPDLLILFPEKRGWAMLEVKASRTSPTRPNQQHYVRVFNEMSFAAFIHPSNEEDVFSELHAAFGH